MDTGDTHIAIVGMAAHLPGAPDLGSYWANLRDGRSSVRRLTEEELIAAGESAAMLKNPAYVPYAAPLDGFDTFDAEFFGFSPKEAAILDPQHRQFLETAWEALENAGHPPEAFNGRIGVFAGCGMGSYFYFNLCSNRSLVDNTGMFLLRHTGNDKDFLSTRVSHIFDLKGPSLSLQTACSTSLVAVHYAVQALLNGECDMALAGGVTIELPQNRGYLYKPGEVLSPDGICHAFDHRGQGTVFGSGAGTVVLRRLSDAIADGDHIWAVVRGSAVNNDGAAKAGYLAPSVEGQAACIAEALEVAGTPADTVDYIECHGTGTYLGDPIEIAALTQAFRRTTNDTGFVRIGSVKTNIGHLDTAAGVASLIKAALSLHHRQMPPSLNFEKPNPAIDFDTSPFRVNDRLTDWPRRKGPRRAGINSLGVGGTNAHVVLEEAPEVAAAETSDWPFQLIALSARSQTALNAASKHLAAHLRAHPAQPLADVAYTLKEGRRAFEHRRVLVAATHEEAARMLEVADPRRIFTQRRVGDSPDVVFMFPGGGAQYPNMARDLYETEPVFADWMDRGLAILDNLTTENIRALWLPEPGAEQQAAETLRRPSLQLPLILIVEIALARLWESWGVRPAALIGHSMGENAAACIAGVMTLEGVIGLVHLRGKLFDTVPAGGMLSVPLSEPALAPYLGDLDIASINAPELTVVSGSDAGLQALAESLRADGVETTRIAINIAAHSRMLDPILADFRAHLVGMTLSPPQIPIISNRTGQPLTTEQATSPDYWVAHLRGTVRFADGIATLRDKPDRVYLEVGPGRALATLAQANGVMGGQPVPSSLRHPDDTVSDDRHFIATLGRLWACGAATDWSQLWGDARRRRVPLPTYPFQRSRYFVEPSLPTAVQEADIQPTRHRNLVDFGYRVAWRAAPADCLLDVESELGTPLTWLVFADEAGLARAAVQRLRGAGHRVITVHAGDSFARTGDETYTLAPEHGREGYEALLADLVLRGLTPARIAHFWLVTDVEIHRADSSFFHRNLEQGFWSLFFLGQALGEAGLKPMPHVAVFTSGAAQVRQEPLPYPEKAAVSGPVRVMPRELPGLTAALLDVALPAAGRTFTDETVSLVLEEMLATPANSVAALRGARRFETRLSAAPLPEPVDIPKGSVWVVTGGLGGIGVTVAERLMRDASAKVALIGRTLPDPGTVRAGVLKRLERLGPVLTLAADVCNPEEMHCALERIRRELGPIHGLVHAAGMVDDAPLLGKDPGAAEAVLSPKVHGTKLLDRLLPDGCIAHLVLFSSTSTVIAPAGQSDYVGANAFLNAFAQHRSGGKTKVTAIDWGIWSGIGMAADAAARRQGEAADAPLPGLPILERMARSDTGARFSSSLSTAQWVMDDHRLKDGTAILPGAAWPEIVAEALSALGAPPTFTLTSLTVLRPIRLDSDSPRDLRISLVREKGGSHRIEARTREQAGWALAVEAEVTALSDSPGTLDLSRISARCPRRQAARDGMALPSAQEDRIAFGPRWQVLRATALGETEGLATLALPAHALRDTETTALHPALYDIGTGWGLALLPEAPEGEIWVPVTSGTVRVFAPLPAEIRSWVRLKETPRPGNASFDVTLTDPSGRVLIEVSGIAFRSVSAAHVLAKPAPPSPTEVLADDSQHAASPAEARMLQALEEGIRPAEGAEAFLRALAADSAQVLVSSIDLPGLVRQADASAKPADADSPGFARPDLDTAYVAPRTEIERTLVGFWSDLLGVGEVGVEDDFFALGGHSLIAVRLFAMIRRQWKLDFPISVLFEAPTIARCAALISEQLGPEAEQATDPTAKANPAGPKFTHLVPMHDGEGGSQTPFFLVAGMGGNVLNLRHLANLLGKDRRFYGLQARGVFGNMAPHETLTEAATDYIAEIRKVQPHGPYLLGGYSGGGLTAWEMAHQLRTAGEEVALTVLLDTPMPVHTHLRFSDRIAKKVAEFREGGVRFFAEWARHRIASERARRARAAGEPDTTVPSFQNAAVVAAFSRAIAVYALKENTVGRVVLFRPPIDRRWKVLGGNWVNTRGQYEFADNQWGQYAPQIEVVEVPGDHFSMVLEPNVRVLVARLRIMLAAADQTPETPSSESKLAAE